MLALFIALSLGGLSLAQQVGTNTAEVHPSLTTYKCTAAGQCTSLSTSVTMDANWRWLHVVGGSTNCYDGNKWIGCTDPNTCTANCALDGADYQGTYGVTASGDSLKIKLVNVHQYGTNVGSRMYLMEDDSHYYQFKVINREFAFDVDVSTAGCGLNGALYFVEMPADGGINKGNNKAGAKYGTGYCDGQCPHDIKFINGEANLLNWSPMSSTSGVGKYGSCCSEMDIWEANSISAAYTPHTCETTGLLRCEDNITCGYGDGNRYKGVCDRDGCDFNSYRMGNTTFYGPGSSFTVDTTQKFTVATQFITDDGTDTGTLVEIRRFYRQNGKVIPNSFVRVTGLTKYNSITDAYCAEQKVLFGDDNQFSAKGGVAGHGEMLKRGVTLVLSLWDDHEVNMLWLDATYPVGSTKVGSARGSCAATSGVPSEVEVQQKDSYVTFSNIRVGELGSTTSGVDAPSDSWSGSVAAKSSTTTKSSAAAQSSTTTKSSTTPVQSSTTTKSSAATQSSAATKSSTATKSSAATVSSTIDVTSSVVSKCQSKVNSCISSIVTGILTCDKLSQVATCVGTADCKAVVCQQYSTEAAQCSPNPCTSDTSMAASTVMSGIATAFAAAVALL